MADKKGKQLDLDFIPPSEGDVSPYYPPSEALYDSPLQDEPVHHLLMAQNNFFSLRKHQTEMPDYVSPDGKYRMCVNVVDKEAGMPIVSDLLIIGYIGAIKRGFRTKGVEDNSDSPRNEFTIKARDYFKFIGIPNPSGKHYEDFERAIRRLKGTEYKFVKTSVEDEFDTDQIEEYQAGDQLNLVNDERFIESSKRLEVKKQDGRTVTAAIQVRVSPFLAKEFIEKTATRIFDRELLSISQPMLVVVYMIVTTMMYKKEAFTISYKNLYRRSNSQNTFRQYKYKLRKLLKEKGLPGLTIDLGDGKRDSITFYRINMSAKAIRDGLAGE